MNDRQEPGCWAVRNFFQMDVSQYAVGLESIDILSKYQIDNFFLLHPKVTKDECNRTAAKITRSVVSPTLVQGQTSYTVEANTNREPKVIQFRDSALDLKLMNQARQTYMEFVPNCKSCGMLADVHVYEMDLIPGVAFSRARRQLFAPEMKQCLLRTVQDFAKSVDLCVPITSSSLLIGGLDSSL